MVGTIKIYELNKRDIDMYIYIYAMCPEFFFYRVHWPKYYKAC